MCHYGGNLETEVIEMETAKLTVRLPKQLHQTLRERAVRSAQSLNKVIVSTLWRGLEREEAEPLSEYERTMAAIRKTGMVTTLGPEWDKYIEAAEDISVEEVRQMWEGLPPLSEDIIADRGER
jgi:hypothetical protein